MDNLSHGHRLRLALDMITRFSLLVVVPLIAWMLLTIIELQSEISAMQGTSANATTIYEELGNRPTRLELAATLTEIRNDIREIRRQLEARRP